MTIDVARLVIEADYRQIEGAEKALDRVALAGERAEKSTRKTQTATERANIAHRDALAELTRLLGGMGAYERASLQAAQQQGAVERATRRSTNASSELRAARALEAASMREAVQAANQYEREQAQLAARAATLKASFDPVGAAIDRVNDELREATALFNRGALSADELGRATTVLNSRIAGLQDAQGRGIGSTKALTQAGLNLGRQFADVGVSLAGGISPLMVLVQQGPQILDVFATAKSQGVGLSQVFGGLAGAINPVTIGIAAVGAAAVAGFALFEREIDKNTKHATTWGDTWKATVKVIGDVIMAGPIGDALRWLGGAFGKTLDAIVDGVMWWVDAVVGHFGAAFELIVKNWNQLPQVFGVIFQGAVNISIRAVEGLINTVIKGVNVLLTAAKMETIKAIDLPEVRLANAKLTAEYERLAKARTESFRAGRESIAERIAEQADKEYLARQKATKATQDHTNALKKNTDAAKANAAWLERATEAATSFAEGLEQQVFAFGKSETQMLRWQAAMAAAAAPTEELKKRIQEAADQLIGLKEAAEKVEELNRAARDFIPMPNPDFGAEKGKIEELAEEFEKARRAAEDVKWAADDIYRSIQENDWLGAFAGLFRVLEQLKTAFSKTGDAASQIGAVAGLGQVVGGAIGGKAGGAISGAASGAMAGMQLGMIIPGIGNVVGAAIGAVVGGIGGFLGGKSKEKEARMQAELAKQQAEHQRALAITNARREQDIRLLELTGKASEALKLRREAELAAMDASLQANQLRIWALEDEAEAASKTADLQIRLMDAQGRASESLALKRAREIAAANDNERGVLRQIFAAEDVATARDALSAAYERERDALQATIDKFRVFADGLKRFRDQLYSGPAAMLSPIDQYNAAKSAFDKTSALAATGDENAIRDLESVSQAYLDASKAYYSSSEAYFKDLERVRAAVTATQAYAASQVSAAEAQLSALNASVAGILGVQGAVLSVKDALAAYNAAIQAQIAAANDNKTATTPGANDNTPALPKAPDWASYIKNNPDVAAEYARLSPNNLKNNLGVTSIEQFGQWHWMHFGQAEGRKPYATGGIIDRPMTLGESGIGGEAGPEGILPLTNVGGRMGVHAVMPDFSEVVGELKSLRKDVDGLRKELVAANTQRGDMARDLGDRLDGVEDAVNRVEKRVKAA